MPRRPERCAYCGVDGVPIEREHVIPRCIYPASRKTSSVQRITVPACGPCNRGWSDDEAHFRSVLVLAGKANVMAQELWRTTITRSLDQRDGPRRARDLFDHIEPVTVDGQNRLMIYPGRDERVMRIVKKIVRGLSHYHEVESALSEGSIRAEVLTYEIPDGFLDSGTLYPHEPGILWYWHRKFDDGEPISAWILTFFDRLKFVAAVSAPQ